MPARLIRVLAATVPLMTAREPIFRRTKVEPVLSAVCFRHRGVDNRELVAAIQADARVFLAGASVDGVDCLRACFVNFRTTDDDVRETVRVVKDVAARLPPAC